MALDDNFVFYRDNFPGHDVDFTAADLIGSGFALNEDDMMNHLDRDGMDHFTFPAGTYPQIDIAYRPKCSKPIFMTLRLDSGAEELWGLKSIEDVRTILRILGTEIVWYWRQPDLGPPIKLH